MREAANSRVTQIDQKSGTVSLVIHDDFGEVEDADHGLINGSVAREWWEIHPNDPLSARARTHWTDETRRGDWSIRTEAYAEMTSDAETFYLTARIEAFEGEKLVFSKDFDRRVPRQLV